MYSDNDTNFVRADRELLEAVQIWQAHDVMTFLEAHAIQRHFNVPSAPHHGGLWEAAVKSTKYHLKRSHRMAENPEITAGILDKIFTGVYNRTAKSEYMG